MYGCGTNSVVTDTCPVGAVPSTRTTTESLTVNVREVTSTASVHPASTSLHHSVCAAFGAPNVPDGQVPDHWYDSGSPSGSTASTESVTWAPGAIVEADATSERMIGP